ncbi:MAG: GreA/GreB family elongation factor [Rhabdochlamydiaceae bacterium]
MTYLEEFKKQIRLGNLAGIIKLWEEYCQGDNIDQIEIKEIFKNLKASEFAELFGKQVHRIIPLCEMELDESSFYEVLKDIIDLQTTNEHYLFELAYKMLSIKFSQDPLFQKRIKLIGMVKGENFQGAISKYELLHHMKENNYVLHNGGWGVGQIIDVSEIRQELTLEFEGIRGKKELSFANALKSIAPINDDHFLALRFGDPEALEAQAKKDPIEVMKLILRDLGPKTALEIKDELYELVIPTEDWAKWWQNTRSKLKKASYIQSPEDNKGLFYLLSVEISPFEKLKKQLNNTHDVNEAIQYLYSFTKDFSTFLKNSEFNLFVKEYLKDLKESKDLTAEQIIQIHFLEEDLFSTPPNEIAINLLKKSKDLHLETKNILILNYKKRFLQLVKAHCQNWILLFENSFLKFEHNSLRDFVFNELLSFQDLSHIQNQLKELIHFPHRYPETFLWYFQKACLQKNIPYADQKGMPILFESLLILLNKVEKDVNYKECVKKIHNIISEDRFSIVRHIFQNASLEQVKEFLLLSTKCQSFADHDLKILHSLAQVVFPSLDNLQKREDEVEDLFIWTTKEGYEKVKGRIQQIGTVETVENAKEIEEARAHGDLRENAEFKSALEKRARLQGELKFLSDQIHKSRIITKEDIITTEIGIGVIVELVNQEGSQITYTLLGPWDADTDKNILSFQSRLAQQMKGKKAGETLNIQGQDFTILNIRSYL